MKHLGIFILLFFTAFLLTSCFESSSSEHHHNSYGSLKIVNNTNAPIYVTWANNTQDIIDANSNTTFDLYMKSSITDPKSTSVSYTCDGLYLRSVTLTDHVSQGEVTTRVLDPNRGCIQFINLTAGIVILTIPGLDDPVSINANGNYTQAWYMTEASNTADFTMTGTYVFHDPYTATVNLNATETYNIIANAAAITVRNYSSETINEVYLSPHSSTDWGNNLLSGTLASTNYASWTVTRDTWDVKVITNSFITTWTENSYINNNQMLVINYYTPTRQMDISRKAEGISSVNDQRYRIEQFQMNMP